MFRLTNISLRFANKRLCANFRTLKTTSIRSKDEGGSIASVFSQF